MDELKLASFLQSLQSAIVKALAVRGEISADRKSDSNKSLGKGTSKGIDELDTQAGDAAEKLSELSVEADKLYTVTSAARKEIFKLAGDVNSTRQNIFAFSAAARGVADSVATLKFDEHSSSVTESGSVIGTLGQSSLLAAKKLDALTRSTGRLDDAFGRVIGTVLRSSAVTAETTETRTEIEKAAAEATDNKTEAEKKSADEAQKQHGFIGGFLRRFGVNINNAGDGAERFSGQMSNLGFAISDALINLTRDIFYLQSRGISGFSGSLIELYGNAMKAGMSLQEYTSMMEENAAAVVRFGSFSEFGDSIDRTTRQLNRLGVFGPAAEQLAASMKTNVVALGIPMAQQEGMIAGQVKVFEQLRKTTLMTADGFRELVADISENENVQEQLLGLAPQERAVRMQQIIQGATIGQQLGATARASKSLTDAILAQRGATVKDRFKAAGSIRMGGALLGMDTSGVEEYARLMLKNPASRTEEENKRMSQLAGDYKQFLEALKNSPNPALENIADELRAFEPQVQADIQKAAGLVKQQAEAGLAINQETGKAASETQQQIGSALTALSGFMKNPLADAMVIFTGMLAQTIVSSTLLAIIASNTSKGPGGLFDMFSRGRNDADRPKPGDFVGPSKPTLTSSPKAFLKLQAAQSPVLNAIKSGFETTVTSLGKIAYSTLSYAEKIKTVAKSGGIWSSVKTLVSDVGSTLGSSGKSIFSGLKTFLGKGGPLAMLFSGVEELFTGDMTAALNLGDGIGGRLIGVVVAAFDGFFSGFARIIDGGINWAMEGLGISWRSNLTSWVNLATLSLVTTFKLLGSGIMQGIRVMKVGLQEVLADALMLIPGVSEKSPWIQSIRKSQQESNDLIKKGEDDRVKLLNEYSETRTELLKEDENGKRNTLRDMGAAQVKAQKETADKVKALTKNTQDNVVNGVENVLSAVNRTTATLTSQTTQASVAHAATPTIATPQPTRQPQVTPPEVNRAQVEQGRTRDATQTADVLTINGMAELLANAQQQLDVLKQMLAYNLQKQPDQSFLGMSQPLFSDNATLFNGSLTK